MSENTIPTPDASADEVTTAEPMSPQLELSELLDGAVRKAVTGQIAARAKQIAEGVVEAMLTPEVLAGMHEAAVVQAELALNPTPDLDPEPESEPGIQDEDQGDGQDEDEPAVRELEYPTAKEFVEQYVSLLYRRDVASRTPSARWCPQWWLHGEARARFEALHLAFEHLRLGTETEHASWWIEYFDPMMDQIMGPEGPFKFCSVAFGHNSSTSLPALKVIAAPALLFTPDRPIAADAYELHVPTPSVGRHHTVMTVDDTAGITRWPEFGR